jgi:8-oxo-dGTP diphosphatase
VAVDAVIFGYFDKKDLQILLIKRNIEPFKGGWALPEDLFWMMKIWMML